MKKLVVVRVDITHPTTWFKGYDQFSNTLTTIHYNEAARMDINEARQAVYGLKIDHGGVWGIREAQD